MVEHTRHPPSKRNDAGENPAGGVTILPDGVKVARRPVKPLVLVRVQVWQPIYGRQADISWLRLSRKQDRLTPEVGALPTPSATLNINERNTMKPIIRYQSQLLYRRSYKPRRRIRIRPIGKLNFVFRPSNRFGMKPQLTIVS